jgi:hypothetical protein
LVSNRPVRTYSDGSVAGRLAGPESVPAVMTPHNAKSRPKTVGITLGQHPGAVLARTRPRIGATRANGRRSGCHRAQRVGCRAVAFAARFPADGAARPRCHPVPA